MANGFSAPTRRTLPLILVRGFGGLGVEDEKRIAYQGFNDGTVYPQKRGDNYIYEGLILRFMKSDWKFQDATNVVGYYRNIQQPLEQLDPDLSAFDPGFFTGKVVIDPGMALHLLRSPLDPCQTLWVFRYYDLDDRKFPVYGEALCRLIDFIRELSLEWRRRNPSASQDGPAPPPPTAPKVNILAHSMGGLLVREAVQRTYPDWKNPKTKQPEPRSADDFINKIVTLGTPHQGISFQILKDWILLDAQNELEHFNPDFQEDAANPVAFVHFHKHFPLDRLLTVVGTDYRSYAIGPSSWMNRLFSVSGEFGPTYNRSDGLVKQTFAQIPGAPRTFVHKCHGSQDSLVTARESFEVATRFFFGNIRARLRLVSANVKRGLDLFGRSEIFLGVSIKPRKVDFELFHQSKQAENCYGPFRKRDLTDDSVAFEWAGPDRLIWEGWLNTLPIENDPRIAVKDMVLRLEFYVGERDAFGVGFSDNLIFGKQYYVRALFPTPAQPGLRLYLHADEAFAEKNFDISTVTPMDRVNGSWEFDVSDTGFDGRFRIEIDAVPEDGHPAPFPVA